MATPTIQQLSSQAAREEAAYRTAAWRLACTLAARAALRIREQYPTATDIQVSQDPDEVVEDTHDGLVVHQVNAAGAEILARHDPAEDTIIATTALDDLADAVRLGGWEVLAAGSAGYGWVSLQSLLDRVEIAG